MTVRKKQELLSEMSKDQESNPLSRNRDNDDGNIEGNEVKTQEAISSLRTLIAGKSDVILFVKCLEVLALYVGLIFILSEISIWLP